MASSSYRRLPRAALNEVLTAAIPLTQLSDYAPFDATISKERIVNLVAQVTHAREQEKLAADAYNTARDQAVAAEQLCYQAVIAARKHCVVQYGENSSVVRALGLKRRIEYKRPNRAGQEEASSEFTSS